MDIGRALLWSAIALFGGPARADTGEGLLRAGPLVRYGRTTAAGETVGLWSGGVQAETGLGLAPAWTLRLGGSYGVSGEGRAPAEASATFQVFHETRLSVAAGATWTPSDASTPFIGLSGGLTRVAQFDRQWRLQTPAGERQVAPFLTDTVAWSPLVRLDAGWEWRFADFWSLSGGLYGEWGGGIGGGALATLTAYRYL